MPGETLAVLTRDLALLQSVKALAADNRIAAVSGESDLAGELLGRHAGVAIIDADAVTTPIDQLTEHLKAQLPDVVLIVAGRLDGQGALAAQITKGTVYRFLHKPASEQRLRLFVEAAWRRRNEEFAAAGAAAAGPATAQRTDPSRNRGGVSRVIMVLVAAGLLAGWLYLRKSDSESGPAPAAAPPEVPAAPSAPSRTTPALTAPARDQEPDSLLDRAEQALAAHRLDEAQKLTDQARSLGPGNVRVAFVAAQIGKQRERLLLTQARQAASSGNVNQAIAVLDGAARGGGQSPLLAQARQELQRKQTSERASDYLELAAARAGQGQLIEPLQDNALFYVESARAVAPNDPAVLQAEQQLADRIVTEARKALAAGDTTQAQPWIDAADEAAVSRDEIGALSRELQRLKSVAKADAMAKLSGLFNQRLADGHVLEPPADSAKFYLAQLAQADGSHPSTVLARQALAARALDEAKAAAGNGDSAGMQRWLDAAREAGADEAAINAIVTSAAAAQAPPPQEASLQQVSPPQQPSAQQVSPAQVPQQQSTGFVPAGALKLTHYVAPTFPVAARQRGISGWVDVQFVVRADGSVSDVSVTGSQPVGMFEQAALDAIRKWQYKPVQKDGHGVEQRARLRLKFALEN